MKLNNKGITLVEIIISIALISIVLLFLFSLLVTVNDMNNESEVNTTYLITKSLILKNIEDDLIKNNDKSIKITNRTCDIKNSFYSSYNSSEPSECWEFHFGDDPTDKAFLAIYYYEPQKSYVISYIHGNVKATRELPEFEKYNVKDNDITNKFDYGTANNFHKIYIPIIGSDGKDYSIIVSYYGTMTG